MVGVRPGPTVSDRSHVYSLAGRITGTWQPIALLNFQVTLADAGELIVGTTSERASLPGWNMNCPVRLIQGAGVGRTPTVFDALGTSACFHVNEPRSKPFLDYVVS